jgi:hypothetical protein
LSVHRATNETAETANHSREKKGRDLEKGKEKSVKAIWLASNDTRSE